MFWRIFTCIAVSALIVSCEAGSKLPVMHLTADIDAPDTENPDGIVEMKMALYPEVTDTTLISNMYVGGIIDGDIYVSSEDLMVFDGKGHCVSSFNHVGPGPEEYGKYDAAFSDRLNGGWIVRSASLPVIKRYTQTGEFLGSDTIISVNNLQPLNDGWIATNNEFINPALTLYYFDCDLSLTDSVNTRFRHRVYSNGSSKSGLQCYMKSNGRQAYIVRHDTVFDITDPKSNPRPVAVAAFRERTLPDDVDIVKEPDWYIKYIEPYYLFGSDYMMAWYKYEGRIAMRVYDFSNGNLVLALSNPLNNDQPGLAVNYDGRILYLGWPVYVQDNSFYFGISDSQMSLFTGDEDANPALFAIEFK